MGDVWVALILSTTIRMDEPKTRTERKKMGKRDGGPFSAKHVRATEALTSASSSSIAGNGGGKKKKGKR